MRYAKKHPEAKTTMLDVLKIVTMGSEAHVRAFYKTMDQALERNEQVTDRQWRKLIDAVATPTASARSELEQKEDSG